MLKKYITKSTLLPIALVLAIGLLITGIALAEDVPTPGTTLRTITGNDFSGGIDLNANQLAPNGTSSILIPRLTGFDSPWVLNKDVNDVATPLEIVDDTVMHGIVDVRNGITNNAVMLMDLTVALAADTPVAAYLLKGAASEQAITAFSLTATGANITITNLTVRRNGFSADSDLSSISVYANSTGALIAPSQNLVSGVASFSLSSPITIRADETENFLITTLIPASATANNTFNLAVNSITATAQNGLTVDAIGLPTAGNTMTIALPDLVTNSINGYNDANPTAASPSGTLRFSGKVQNVGFVRPSANAASIFCIDNANSNCTGSAVIYITPLNPGASTGTTNSTPSTWPSWPTSGYHRVYYCVDGRLTNIPESNETNNCSNRRFKVDPTRTLWWFE